MLTTPRVAEENARSAPAPHRTRPPVGSPRAGSRLKAAPARTPAPQERPLVAMGGSGAARSRPEAAPVGVWSPCDARPAVFLRGPSPEMLVSYERLTLNGMPDSAFAQRHIDHPGRLQVPHGEIWLYTKIITTETPPRAGASVDASALPGPSRHPAPAHPAGRQAHERMARRN